jgi:hypothetical protein
MFRTRSCNIFTGAQLRRSGRTNMTLAFPEGIDAHLTTFAPLGAVEQGARDIGERDDTPLLVALAGHPGRVAHAHCEQCSALYS